MLSRNLDCMDGIYFLVVCLLARDNCMCSICDYRVRVAHAPWTAAKITEIKQCCFAPALMAITVMYSTLCLSVYLSLSHTHSLPPENRNLYLSCFADFVRQ